MPPERHSHFCCCWFLVAGSINLCLCFPHYWHPTNWCTTLACARLWQLANRVMMIVTHAVKEACGFPAVTMCRSFLFYNQLLFQYFNLLSFVPYIAWSCSLLFRLQFCFWFLFCSFSSIRSYALDSECNYLYVATYYRTGAWMCYDIGEDKTILATVVNANLNLQIKNHAPIMLRRLDIRRYLQLCSSYLFQVMWSGKYNLMNLFGARVSVVILWNFVSFWSTTYVTLIASDSYEPRDAESMHKFSLFLFSNLAIFNCWTKFRIWCFSHQWCFNCFLLIRAIWLKSDG